MKGEEEKEALANIHRNRRLVDSESLHLADVQMLGDHYSRIGKAKSVSGQAYREMTTNVIVSGAFCSSFSCRFISF